MSKTYPISYRVVWYDHTVNFVAALERRGKYAEARELVRLVFTQPSSAAVVAFLEKERIREGIPTSEIYQVD